MGLEDILTEDLCVVFLQFHCGLTAVVERPTASGDGVSAASASVERHHVSAEHVRHPLGTGGDFRVGARGE
jgi:hypothetical protein